MAGTVPVITPGSITAMAGLAQRPVYFVSMNGAATPNLVVKGDAAGADVSIKWGSKLMKNVNNDQVNTKIMTQAEIAVFTQFALATFAVNSPQHNNAAGGTYTWVKMPFVAGLSDAAAVSDANPMTGQLRDIVGKFLDSAVWNQLGKVVAVDIFNGNNDRFQVLDGAMSPLGSWNNKGNVMFLAPGAATKVIGLDTYDPASSRSSLTAAGHFNELMILIDSARRNAFATAAVKDVGNELKRTFQRSGIGSVTLPPAPPGRANAKIVQLGELASLYMVYMPSFASGIATGADELKTYLKNKVRQYAPPTTWVRAAPGGAPVKTIPKGVLDRMAFLGW